jgi:DNA-binding CsgD family transcriptional regulator
MMIVNPSAGELLHSSDRPRLWALAQDAVKGGTCRIGEVSLSNGASVMARYRPVLHAGELAGVLVQFTVPHGGRTGVPFGPARPRRSPVPGWWELTNAERAIAEVVASGLTNREAGRRVYLSPHTVDAHLRHIFRKLGIKSRVELALLCGQHYDELRRAEEEAEEGAVSSAKARHPSCYKASRSA